MPDHDPQHAAHLVLLAYQSGLIDRPAFDAILDAWHTDRSRPVPELLAELGKVSAESLPFLDALARRHAQDLGGTTQALSALAANAGSSTVEELATRVPEFTETFIVRTPSLTQIGPDMAHSTTSDHMRPGGVRYKAIRFHARGGLGAVFVAQDEELNRKVALKEIQERYADRPADRDRFLVEAEITGRLEHPGIVPVYGLGTYADGRPFYAMRFIYGESLETACRAFHSNPDPDSSARSVALRGLLRRFLDVCNAVEYAHSRGVLHRDLKPGNIMVGKYGETLVVDWGLARVMGESTSPPSDDHDAPIDRSSLSGSAQTIRGHAIGTPGYMSPEQADGRHDELGPESDVYSLGATLYFVLTGRGPYSGVTSLTELYARLRHGDHPPARSINPEIPVALDAICRKAMSVSPTDRYPTPRALADDLEHYLADESVDASPDTPLDRLMRWTRKHKQATITAAAALLIIATVATFASFVVDSARRSAEIEKGNARLALRATQAANARAEEALSEANRAQAQAYENFKKAQQTVDDLLTAVSESKELQLLPDTQNFRRRLLEKARDYYQEFLKIRAGNNSLRFETGMSALRLARVVKQIDTNVEATRICLEALRLVEPIASSNESSVEQRVGLARILANLSGLMSTNGKFKEAEEYCHRALMVRERIAHEHPSSEEYQISLARSLNDIGAIQTSTGRLTEGERSYLRSEEIFSNLARMNPKAAEYSEGAALALTNLALVQRNTGRQEAAKRSLARAVKVREKLVDDAPNVADYRSGLARSLNDLSAIQFTTGDVTEAEVSIARSIAIRETLASENPKVIPYRIHLAHSFSDMGAIRQALGQPTEAEAAIKRAYRTFKDVTQEQPDVAEYQHALGLILNDLATLRRLTGRLEEARDAYEEATSILER